MKKKKLGLVPKLIIAIILGILFGSFLPESICRVIVTASGLFSTFLKFVIPLMIVAYVTMGIADLSQGAGKLLLITVCLAYGSTLIAGTCSYLVASGLFPSFMSPEAMEQRSFRSNSVAMNQFRFSQPISRRRFSSPVSPSKRGAADTHSS